MAVFSDCEFVPLAPETPTSRVGVDELDEDTIVQTDEEIQLLSPWPEFRELVALATPGIFSYLLQVGLAHSRPLDS